MGALKVTGVIILVVALTIGLVGAAFGFRVATAGLVGAGQQHIQNQGVANRVVQQASFETSYADWVGYTEKLKDANTSIAEWDKANVGWQARDNAIGSLAQARQYLVTVRDGLRQQCQNTVANYNADTHKSLAQDWKRGDLPYELDPTASCR